MSTFVLNSQFLYELNIAQPGEAENYVRLAEGISSLTPNSNDVLSQDFYLDNDGNGNTDKTGQQLIYTGSGHRALGDPAQDFIFSKRLALGDDCKTSFRQTDPDGLKILMPSVTICNVTGNSGDANAKSEIGFEIHVNGAPTITPKTAAAALSATISGGSAIGTTSFSATPAEGNVLKYKLGSASVGTVYDGQLVKNLISYTDGSDIVATVDQYLAMYEIDQYGRVVKFLEDQLEAGDITSV